MAETRVFNANVFESYSNLQNYLNSSKSFQEVLDRKDIPYSGTPIPLQPNLDCKWQVCQTLTSPFRILLSIFLQTTAKCFKYCGSAQPAKTMKNWSIQLEIGFKAFSNETTKVSRIISTVNGPNQEGIIVNEHPAIPESQVAMSVRDNTFCSLHHQIKFRHDRGICRGMGYWFLNLYLKTKDQFTDPRAHMLALGKQFKKGGGADPTLMQSIYLRAGELLKLKIGTQSAASSERIPLIQKTPHEWRAQSNPLIQQLKILPVGAYAIALPLHQTAFVKINDQLGYFFEPNRGIEEIQGNELAEKLYDRVTLSLARTGDGETTRYIPHVDINPVTLRG